MNWKAGVAVAAAVGVIGSSAMGALDPSAKTVQEVDRTHQQQMVKQASDAQKLENERRRRAGVELGKAVQREHLVPVEPRPVEPAKPRVRIRVRLP